MSQRTDEEIKEIHRLREGFVHAKNTGEHAQLNTEDLVKIEKRLNEAAHLLVMFPQCDSTRTWCLHEANALGSIVRARKRRD